MKIARNRLRQILSEEIEQVSIPDSPGEGETPGWYVTLVNAIDALHRNDETLLNNDEIMKDEIEKIRAGTVTEISRNNLRSIIIKELKEELAGRQAPPSELSERVGGGSGFNRASQAKVDRDEIDAQLSDMGPIDTDTIGDLLPISRDEWMSYSGVPGPDGEASEKMAYLIDLAWDIHSERVVMAPEDLNRLIELAPEEFEMQLAYAGENERVEDEMDDAFGIN